MISNNLNVPKRLRNLARNLYSVELSVWPKRQVFGTRNIDILPLFCYIHMAIVAARKESEQAELLVTGDG